MGVFTTLSSGGNAQTLAIANELITTYNEHREILASSTGAESPTPVASLGIGDNAQDKTLWNTMQAWLEANCVNFIDHVNGPLLADESEFRKFTLATWRTASGMGSGFRRKVNMGDDFSYGTIQTGDIRGNWCFEDLQNGFSMLRQISWGNITVVYKSKGYATGQVTQSSEAIREICIAGWNAASWGGGGWVTARAWAAGNFAINKFGEKSGHMSAYRDAWLVTLLFSADCVGRAVDEYFSTQVYQTLYDIDSMGLEAQGVSKLIKEYGVFSETSKELDWLAEGGDVCPWALITEGLPDPPPDYSKDLGYRGGTGYNVKPVFTYQN